MNMDEVTHTKEQLAAKSFGWCMEYVLRHGLDSWCLWSDEDGAMITVSDSLTPELMLIVSPGTRLIGKYDRHTPVGLMLRDINEVLNKGDKE